MDCDLGLFDVAVGMLSYLATWHLNGEFEPRRTAHSAHPSLVPFQNFETSDGWIVVGCAKEKFWRRLAEVLDLPGFLEDPRFADFAARRDHADDLLPELEARFRTRSSADWLDALKDAGVPSGPIQSVAEALADPQTQARGLIVEVDHPRFGTVRQIASPVRVGEGEREYRRAPQRHEHGPEILQGLLGYSGEQVAALAGQGAFSASRPVGVTGG
jgi:crotonobetainyl-CoA:carnitine CoA-transferase CaiB-like acyl-CoA transferase